MSTASTMADAFQTFLAEGLGLLQEMDEGLLRLEDVPTDEEAINAVFRAAHTIKGSAGLFGLDEIVAFTHNVESVLDRVREGTLSFSGDMVGVMFRCRDHMGELLLLISNESEIGGALRHEGEQLSELLRRHLGDSHTLALQPDAPRRQHAQLDTGPDTSEDGALQDDTLHDDTLQDDTWHISLRFAAAVLQNGMDPASFIRYLNTLGEVTQIETLFDTLPPAEQMNPELCYLGFEIRFRGDVAKSTIEGIFDFVRDDCALRILQPGSKVSDYLQLIQELPEEDLRLGDLLVKVGAITQRELERGLATQQSNASVEHGSGPLGSILVEQHAVQPELVDAAVARQQDVRQRQNQESRLIRVHADKLDSLINLVGELVIANAGVGLLAVQGKDTSMIEAHSDVSRLVEDIRDEAMRLRMVEIGETFNRFRRVVRDVARELGKDIALTISGADTELDKSVVERIADPLTHLVRNAVDHGIESAAERLAAGKPAQGQLHLNAFHESGNIIIEVSDDGGGLDRERILTKAIEKGLVSPGDNLSDREICNLIFEAGFSTSDTVSNLSGRGVGMDVVRRNIQALRGTVEIDTQQGVGSIFRLRLPLTLAIIDGFLMGVGEDHYVVPLDMVVECVELQAGSDASQGYINLRNEALPLLLVRQHFGLPAAERRRQNVVVVNDGGRKAGLVVDDLKGELQAVVKPLGSMFDQLRGISGSTILGSGEVALMLDVPVLLQQATRQAGTHITH